MISQKSNKSLTLRLFEMLVIRSWWVLIFLILCYSCYNIVNTRREKAIFDLQNKYESLLQEKQLALQTKEDLNLRLLSQSDPAWIEMTLMKELGVVPENKIKVHFKN